MVLIFTRLILDGKDHLSKIWLAAHWEKKLKKYQIYQIDIESSVREILTRELILDLRLSGHLLVGIVRIFSRKAKYLLSECNDIFARVKGFNTTVIDFPPSKTQAPYSEITLPELFEELNFDKIGENLAFTSNQSRIEDITLNDGFGNMQLISDEFDEINFAEEDNVINFDEDFQLFMDEDQLNGGPKENAAEVSVKPNLPTVNDIEENFNEKGNRPLEMESDLENYIQMDTMHGSEESTSEFNQPKVMRHVSASQELIFIGKAMQRIRSELSLEPLSSSTLRYGQQRIRQKRKLIIDELKVLPPAKCRKQFQDTLDAMIPVDLAPPSKRLMILKTIGMADQLLKLPVQKMGNSAILSLYSRCLKTSKDEDDASASSCEEDSFTAFSEKELPRQNDSITADVPRKVSLWMSKCDDFEEFSDMNETLPYVENSDSSSNDAAYQIQKGVLCEEQSFGDKFRHDISNSDNVSEYIQNIFQEKDIKILRILQCRFKESSEIAFSKLIENSKRTKVAQSFLSLLTLKKSCIVELKQSKPNGEILITKGTNLLSDLDDCSEN